MPDIETQLRDAIAASGLTDTEVARRAGVAQPVVFRFRKRQRGLSSESFSKIAGALGLELRPAKRRRRCVITDQPREAASTATGSTPTPTAWTC